MEIKKQTQLKSRIKAKGLLIGYIETEAKMPTNTLYNYINGSKALPVKHLPRLKKVLKKYKINFVV